MTEEWRVGLNISRLRELFKALPDSFDPTELKDAHAQELCDELDEMLGAIKDARRKADEEELAATVAKLNALQAKLGVKAPPPDRPSAPRTELDETDAGNGIGEAREATTGAQDFRDELAALRERTQMKRRRL